MFKMTCSFILWFFLLGHVSGDILSMLKNHTAVIDSSECSNALKLYMENIVSSPPDDNWAIKMLDASSKLPAGLLSLNFGEMGDFEECLATESLDGAIQPRYCLGRLSLSGLQELSEESHPGVKAVMEQINFKARVHRLITSTLKDNGTDDMASTSVIGPTWAVCLPKNCSESEINTLFSPLPMEFSCQTREDTEPPLTSEAISTIVVFIIIICIMIASTVYDLYCNSNSRVPPRPLLVTFSLYTNGSKLFKMGKSSSGSEFSCINGLRVLSMIWVIIGHTFLGATYAPTSNFYALIQFNEQLYSMLISSGTLAVDTFFFIGGVVLSYSFMKMKFNAVKFNIFQYYIHRYIRLTSPLAAMVLITATLSPYFGKGPHWPLVKVFLGDACKKDWWTALSYTQNYYRVSNDSMCIGQSWYLDIDMQLFVLSPMVLLPLFYYPLVGLCLLYGFTGATIVAAFLVGYINKLSAMVTATTTEGGDFNLYYLKTHTRAAPWLMGVILGYYLSLISLKNKKVPQLRRDVIIIVWAACLAVMLTCVFGGHSTLMGPEYDRWGNSLHLAFVRPVWSLCIAWVILACYLNYGGPINTFLSLPIFQVLSRFTFSMYLIHLNLIYYRSFSHKTGVHFSFFDMTCEFWNYLMYSFGLSIFWALAFESPFIALEKILLK